MKVNTLKLLVLAFQYSSW